MKPVDLREAAGLASLSDGVPDPFPSIPSEPMLRALPHLPPPVRSSALAALRTPLAAVLSDVQMMRQNILSGAPLPREEHVAVLTRIERTLWALDGQLRVLQDAADRFRNGAASDTGYLTQSVSADQASCGEDTARIALSNL